MSTRCETLEYYTKKLTDATTFGSSEPLSEAQFYDLLCEAEQCYPNSDSAIFEWALGGGWFVHTFQNVRGAARKEGYEKAVTHWERGHDLGKRNGGPDFVHYTMLLGRLYVSQAKVGNVPRALELYAEVYGQSCDYEPLLLPYAEGLYRTGDYDKAIDVAMDLHYKAKGEFQGDQFPPAAIDIALRAYRAKIKEYYKGKQYAKALEVSTKLLATQEADEDDAELHQNLKKLVAQSTT